MSKGDITVCFNPEQQDLYRKLKDKGLASMPLPLFVRTIFYAKVDELNINSDKK